MTQHEGIYRPLADALRAYDAAAPDACDTLAAAARDIVGVFDDARARDIVARYVDHVSEEIIRDMYDGIIPVTVRHFSELHDYLDANEYGEGILADADGMDPDERVRVINMCQNGIDVWLKERADDMSGYPYYVGAPVCSKAHPAERGVIADCTDVRRTGTVTTVWRDGSMTTEDVADVVPDVPAWQADPHADPVSFTITMDATTTTVTMPSDANGPERVVTLGIGSAGETESKELQDILRAVLARIELHDDRIRHA